MNEEIGFDFGHRCRENHPIYFLGENSRHYHRRSPLFLGNPPSRKRAYTLSVAQPSCTNRSSVVVAPSQASRSMRLPKA